MCVRLMSWLSKRTRPRCVSARAEAMQKCCEKTPGTMAAVIGLDAEVIENVCKDVCSENCGMVLAVMDNYKGGIFLPFIF